MSCVLLVSLLVSFYQKTHCQKILENLKVNIHLGQPIYYLKEDRKFFYQYEEKEDAYPNGRISFIDRITYLSFGLGIDYKKYNMQYNHFGFFYDYPTIWNGMFVKTGTPGIQFFKLHNLSINRIFTINGRNNILFKAGININYRTKGWKDYNIGYSNPGEPIVQQYDYYRKPGVGLGGGFEHRIYRNLWFHTSTSFNYFNEKSTEPLPPNYVKTEPNRSVVACLIGLKYTISPLHVIDLVKAHKNRM